MRRSDTLLVELTDRARLTNGILIALLWVSLSRLTARPIESALKGSTLFAWLFRESGGPIAVPLLLGLFLLAELWRRRMHAPGWPHLLLPALLAPPVFLSALGASWAGIDHGVGVPTWRDAVLQGVGWCEILLAIACVWVGRRRWPIMLCIACVTLFWTFTSWIGAALSVGADSL